MVRSLSTPVATRAAFAIAMALISCRSVSAQSDATALGTQAHATTLQRAVRVAVERAGPHVVSQSPAPQRSTKATWDAVRQLAPGARVTVHVRNGSAARGHLVAATTDSLTVRTSSGERSVARTQITKVTAPNRSLRVLIGVLGVAGGAAAGFLACPYCANEGSPEITTTYMAVGAAAGSAAFLISPSRTIYEEDAP